MKADNVPRIMPRRPTTRLTAPRGKFLEEGICNSLLQGFCGQRPIGMLTCP
jgi:hypothetical protein